MSHTGHVHWFEHLGHVHGCEEMEKEEDMEDMEGDEDIVGRKMRKGGGSEGRVQYSCGR